MHGHHFGFGQPRGHFGEEFHVVALAIIEIIGSSCAITGHQDDATHLVTIGIDKTNLPTREMFFEAGALFSCCFVEVVANRFAMSGTKGTE